MPEPIFTVTTSPNLFDKMGAEYSHPERLSMFAKLRELESKGTIELKTVGGLFSISKEKTTAMPDEALPCIEMQDVDVDYGLVNLKVVRVSEAGTSRIACRGGQILFSGLRPYLNKIALLPSMMTKAICSGEFYVLTPLEEKIPTGYIWLVLRSEFVLDQIRYIAGGSLRPRIGKEDISDIEVPILKNSKSLSEIDSSVNKALEDVYSAQPKLRLAGQTFLNTIDLPPPSELSNSFFGFAETQKDSPRQFYRMDALFFHPSYYEELRVLLEKWKETHHGSVVRLNDLCIPNGIKRWKPRVSNWNGQTPRLGVENITETGILWDCKHVEIAPKQADAFLRRMDILITSTGVGSTGRIGIFDEDLPAVTDGHVTVVRLKKDVSPYYVLAYLRCEYAKRQLSRMERGSSGQIELYPEDIKNLLLPVAENTVINKAERKLKEPLENIRIAKSTLHKTRTELMEDITNTVTEDDCPKAETTVPLARWRIIRP